MIGARRRGEEVGRSRKGRRRRRWWWWWWWRRRRRRSGLVVWVGKQRSIIASGNDTL